MVSHIQVCYARATVTAMGKADGVWGRDSARPMEFLGSTTRGNRKFIRGLLKQQFGEQLLSFLDHFAEASGRQ